MKKVLPKIIVAHPGQQHSYKVATALNKAGFLYKYCTCIYDKQNSVWMKIVRFFVRGKNIERLQKRKSEFLEDKNVILYYTFLSLVVIVFSKYKLTKKISYWLSRKISDSFGIKIAKYAIKHNVDAVICFSTNETKCFEYLRKHAPHIKRICDCASSPRVWQRKIYEEDMKLFNHEELKKEASIFFKDYFIKQEENGIQSTNFFLAPSNFVVKGLVFCGVKEEQIFVIPYGSNFDVTEKQINTSKEIRFLYVGQVSYRKGMHHLLKVFSKIQHDNAFLDVVGAFNKDGSLYEKYKIYNNIKFYGNVLHGEVKNFLLKDDVFVFPSLADSFGLACLEACLYGLPLISSKNSIACDMIENGYNGFVFDYDDEQSLEKYIKYFIENKDEIHNFSKNILETSKNYTWENYNIKLKNVIESIFTKMRI